MMDRISRPWPADGPWLDFWPGFNPPFDLDLDGGGEFPFEPVD